MVVLSATVLATMNVMGVTLIAATLVVPAVVARMLTDSFGKMLGLSAVIGAASGFVGMNASYHLDVASGPTIVLTSASFFIVAYLVRRPLPSTRRLGRPRPLIRLIFVTGRRDPWIRRLGERPSPQPNDRDHSSTGHRS